MIPRAIAVAVLLVISAACRAQAAGDDGGSFRCLIKPNRVVNVGSSAEGVLDAILVERDDVLKAGQVVARLRSGLEEASVRLAGARAESDVRIRSGEVQSTYQQGKLERTKRLFARKVLSSATLDEVKADAELAELAKQEAELNKRIAALELAQAREILDRRTIRSPIDGVVVERGMEIGEYVHEQASLMVVAELDPLKVEVFVPVARYGAITKGMRGEIAPQQPVGGTHIAVVTIVDRVFDAASGTFGVRLELPNPGYRLPAGLRCQVRFLPGH